MQAIQKKNKRIEQLEKQLMEAQNMIEILQHRNQVESLNVQAESLCECTGDVLSKTLNSGSKDEVRKLWNCQKKRVTDYMRQMPWPGRDAAAVSVFRLREQLLEISRFRFEQLMQLEEFSVS